jgi:two-component system, OmpR family, alkaline phosphatase synthesis response regulator PhoP
MMPANPAPPSSHDTHLPTSSILIVDDNSQNAELLQAYLEGLNCTSHVAVDGVDALEKVAQLHPDLILLDIMMPRMSGFEVCRRLKADPKYRDIPIIMVTALNELGDIERGVESGTDDFLSKPINKLELVTRVKSLLRVRHLKSQLERTLAYLGEMESGMREQESGK